MPLYKLTLEYDGAKFCGWQIQEKSIRTVQGELKKALDLIFKEPVIVIGAGRTDSGVHATAQTAHFKTSRAIEPKTLIRALNANLPDDIAVLTAQRTRNDFHAQFNAKSKIYRYTILNQQNKRVKGKGLYYHVPQPLDIPLMKRESKTLIGRHDFRSFVANDPQPNSKTKGTIRTIKKISFKQSQGFLYIDIEADGFLYKMVRNIVGTLVRIGLKRMPQRSLKKILRAKCRESAGPTAPAQGLCLVKVKY